MSVLALKAIDYGAEQIPDKFFEKIPGGFFTPAEKKKIKKDRAAKKDRKRHSSEQRSGKRSSQRDRSPHSDSTDSAYDDTDYEHDRERRRRDRSRRAKSVGRTSSRSLSRGRNDRRSEHLDGGYSDSRDMVQAEQGGPYFPPPPSSEYRPYNPQDYASGRPQSGDYRPSSAGQPYGYPPQVNDDFFRSRSATVPTMAAFSTPVNASPLSRPPVLMSRPPSNLPTPLSPQPPLFDFIRQGTPLSAAFSPSTEPPLAALFSRPLTNTPKPATAPPHSSAAAARYAPGPGYAPSPPVNSNIPAPPVGVNTSYPPYNPSDYASGYQPSPPPFNRQRSNSQPANPPYPTYIPPNTDQRMAAYDEHNQPPSRRDSTKPRREHRHRARSADTHSSSRKDYDRDHRPRDSSRMTKMRERFDDGFLRDGGLAASLGGALVGGFAGNKVGRSKLTTIAGAAAGALGAKTLAERRSKSRGARSRSHSRSRSRTRHGDRAHSRDRTPPRGLRARSRSVIDRFRSKSRGAEDRKDRHGRSDRYDRPDHGYDRGRDDEYDYFSSESEGDASPVTTRRHRKRRDY